MAALARPTARRRPRARLRSWASLLDAVLFVLACASVARFAITAVSYGIPAWFDEELPPLIQWRQLGTAIAHIDQRQYGPLVFLVFDPAIHFLGADYGPLQRYALVLAVAAIVASFFLVGRRYAHRCLRAWLALTLVWFSFVPTLYVVAQRMVDAWQLLLVCVALLLFTSSSSSSSPSSSAPRRRALAGIPLALAALTKLLPGVLLLYVALRDWRAGLTGLATGGVVLGLAQLLYGSLLGFGYPLALLAGGSSTVASWSLHYENNSVRGLLFKVADGYRLAPDSMQYLFPADRFAPLNVIAYALEAALLAYLLVRAWRARRVTEPEGAALGFCLAITTMLLVSPHTAQDYTIVLLPVFAVGAWCALRQRPQPWSTPLLAGAIAGALLVGVFVPLGWVDRLPPLRWLEVATGNGSNAVLTGDVGVGIGAYDFFGLPGLGLLVLWLVTARLEWLCSRRPGRERELTR